MVFVIEAGIPLYYFKCHCYLIDTSTLLFYCLQLVLDKLVQDDDNGDHGSVNTIS